MSLEDELRGIWVLEVEPDNSDKIFNLFAGGLFRLHSFYIKNGEVDSSFIRSLRREITYTSSVKGKVRQMIYALGIGFSNEGLPRGKEECLYFLEYLTPSEKPQVLAIPIRDIVKLEKI